MRRRCMQHVHQGWNWNESGKWFGPRWLTSIVQLFLAGRFFYFAFNTAIGWFFICKAPRPLQRVLQFSLQHSTFNFIPENIDICISYHINNTQRSYTRMKVHDDNNHLSFTKSVNSLSGHCTKANLIRFCFVSRSSYSSHLHNFLHILQQHLLLSASFVIIFEHQTKSLTYESVQVLATGTVTHTTR